jgi:hypothetical protein
MPSIINHDCLMFNCNSIEFLLIDLVNIGGRLNALIGVERDIVAMNDKKPKHRKSK